MRKFIYIFCVLTWVSISVQTFANEGQQPLEMREGSNVEASRHNLEGIASFNQGNFKEAARQFKKVLKIDPLSGEGYFNEALSLYRLGFQNDAANYFYYAKKYSQGNKKITNSNLVRKYVPAKPRVKARPPANRSPYRREGS